MFLFEPGIEKNRRDLYPRRSYKTYSAIKLQRWNLKNLKRGRKLFPKRMLHRILISSRTLEIQYFHLHSRFVNKSNFIVLSVQKDKKLDYVDFFMLKKFGIFEYHGIYIWRSFPSNVRSLINKFHSVTSGKKRQSTWADHVDSATIKRRWFSWWFCWRVGKLPEEGGAAERDVGPAESRDPRLVFLGGPRLPIKSRTLDLRVQTYERTGGRGGCRYTMLRRRNGKFFGNDWTWAV